MSCHPKHIELPPLELPPLERRPLLVEAGRLRAKGLKLRQIAKEMGCSRGTAANYLEEYERHRFQLLQVVAVDQLLGSVLELVAPNDNHQAITARDRLHAARELRLLLGALPALGEHDEQQRHAFAEYNSRAQAWKEHAESEQRQRQEQASNNETPANNGWTA